MGGVTRRIVTTESEQARNTRLYPWGWFLPVSVKGEPFSAEILNTKCLKGPGGVRLGDGTPGCYPGCAACAWGAPGGPRCATCAVTSASPPAFLNSFFLTKW